MKSAQHVSVQPQEHALSRLQHVTAVYFFELKSPATRSGTIRGYVLRERSQRRERDRHALDAHLIL